MHNAGVIAAQPTLFSPIPVPLAELFAVAVEHEAQGRYQDAGRLIGHILAAEPDQADALHLKGVLAARDGQFPQAAALIEQSIRHGVNTPVYWRNLGEIYRRCGVLDKALVAGKRAVVLNPDDAGMLSNLAVIHADRAEYAAADQCSQAALALDPAHPAAHFVRADMLLRQGEMQRGWEEYEWRFHLPGGAKNLPPAALRPPQWDGRPMPDGRVLVVADQGFGDIIQFCRYIPWIVERCPELVFAGAPALRPFLRQFGDYPLHTDWAGLPPCSAYITLSGMPRLAGSPVDGTPAQKMPYLRANPAQAALWKARIDRMTPAGHRRIGLAWAGSPKHAGDHRRSIDLSALAPLARLRHTVLVSLQKGERMSQAGQYFGTAPLLNLAPLLADWDDTMAVLGGLDAVVAVDTSVAHLAGAMGRPVHILLPHQSEWRWLEGRGDSPWYPTARLHRQPRPGAWAEAVEALATELAQPGLDTPHLPS